MIIDAIVGGHIRLLGVPPKQTERIRNALSFPNPEFHKLQRLGRYTGGTEERICVAVETPEGDLLCPRGSWTPIRTALAKDGWTTRVTSDERSIGSVLVLSKSITDISLRDYQREGVLALVRNTQGLVVIPCGGGKSRLGVAAIAAIGRSALIIVHTTDLADQWVETIKTLLHVDAGRIDATHDQRLWPIVVATVQSLYAILEENPINKATGYSDDEFLSYFGMVILDEAHRAPAMMTQRVLSHVTAKHRLGLTATPEREDGMTKLVEWSFGPTLLERTTPELIKLGYLMKAEVEFVETGFAFAYDGSDEKRLAALDRALEKDAERNTLIAARAHIEASHGEAVLVLTNRKTHATKLAKMITACGTPAEAVIGTTAKGLRKETIARLKSGDLRVMVATSLADEGLDVQRLSRVLLAWPQRAKGATTQRVGRLLRGWPGKQPKLFDFVDGQVPTLASRASARRSTFRKLGLL